MPAFDIRFENWVGIEISSEAITEQERLNQLLAARLDISRLSLWHFANKTSKQENQENDDAC
jgi:hypothetical protein